MASRQRRRKRRMQGQAWLMDGEGVKSITLSDGLGAWQSLNQTGGGYTELGRHEWGYAQAYVACGWAKRAIDIRVQKVSELLRKGKVVDKTTGKAIPDHPFMRALDIAFREYEQEPFEEWEFSKSVYGESFAELVSMYPFGNPGPSFPATLRVLNALAIEPVAPRGRIEYYDYSGDDGHVRFMPDEIAYDKFRNPFNDARGLSLLAAALDAVNIDRSLLLVTRSYLKNNARPGLIFTPKTGVLQPNDKERITTTVKERVKGPTNAGKPLLFEVPLDVTVVSPPTFEDQDILTQQQKERICAVIGVPVSLVTFGDMKYQLSPEQRKGLYTETIIPESDKIARVVDVKVLPFFDPSDQARFSIDDAVTDLLASLEDPAARASIANGQLAVGGISLNEYRQMTRQAPLPNGDVYYMPLGIQVVPAAQIGSVPTPAPASPFAAVTTPALPAPEADKDIEGQALCLMLDLGGDVNLLDLQGSVKRLLGDTPMRWNDPASFHVTLFYAPIVTETQVEQVKAALQALELPELSLRIGSLNVFDNLGEYAVHFRIRQNADLLDLQETLYHACVDAGIVPSAYSVPDQYKPHITMGYADSKPRAVTFMSKLTVTPSALLLAVGDEIYRVVDSAPPSLQDDAIDELRAWEKKTLNKGASKALDFACHHVDAITAELVRLDLLALPTDAKAIDIRALFTTALDGLALKAYPETRDGFYQAVLSTIRAGQAEDIQRRGFGAAMRVALRRFGLVAFRDGLTRGGYPTDQGLTPDMASAFRAWLSEQSSYVTHFGAEIYQQGITETEVQYRAQLWTNKSLDSIYYRGLALAAPEKQYRWRLGNTVDHCQTCADNHGQVKTMAEWVEAGLPRTHALDCGGWNCDCSIEEAE